MSFKILTDLRSAREIVEEERVKWIDNLLYFLGLDVEYIKQSPGDVAIEYLYKNHVQITDYPSIGAIKIEYRPDHQSELEVVGEWAGPEYQIKLDSESGEYYYEISIECWSVIDEGIDMEES